MLAIVYTGNRFDIVDMQDISTCHVCIEQAYRYKSIATVDEIYQLFLKNKKLIINNSIADYGKKASIKISAGSIDGILESISSSKDTFYIVIDVVKREDKNTIVYLEAIENTFFNEMNLPVFRHILIDDILKDLC